MSTAPIYLVERGGDLRENIRRNLRRVRVTMGQLDVNGRCNASCWYCPVRYEGNPALFAAQMPLEDVDLVLRRIRASSVVENIWFLYTAHYNEVLLFKKFEGLLDVFRRNGLRTMILSNGTTISPDKTDIIMRSRDVVNDIALNVPSLVRDDWALKAGFRRSVHPILLRNLDYLHERQQDLNVIVVVNSMTDRADLLPGSLASTDADVAATEAQFRERYPRFRVAPVTWLVDRAGRVPVIRNRSATISPDQRVIGCSHSDAEGSRVYGWLHVNARGDVFLCCDDYRMEYRFGNLLTQSLDEIWYSEEHVDAIAHAFGELCRRCVHHRVI